MIEMDIVFFLPLVFKAKASLYLILHLKAQSFFHEHFTYIQKFEVIGPIPEKRPNVTPSDVLNALVVMLVWLGLQFKCTGRERLIRSHSSARFCFELSGNSN